jgi:hypothetical protein
VYRGIPGWLTTSTLVDDDDNDDDDDDDEVYGRNEPYQTIHWA